LKQRLARSARSAAIAVQLTPWRASLERLW
jgi:hypothetical protein